LIVHAVISRFHAVSLLIFLFLVAHSAGAQSNPSPAQPRNWDFSVWAAGATGEENTNSFSEAQILSAGFFAGKVLTGEIGSGWRRGRFEYGVDVIPLFRQFQPQSIYGGGFEPVILRWNSSLHTARVAPYIELAGGAIRTNTNFPAGDTSNFNFTARGGGGLQLSAKSHHALDIGCRWSHISNANLGTRNTEFNGIQVSLGYHWFP
jgi:Lipid A 3-O-deacylase (PagL)